MNCPVCGNNISDKAIRCPRCGFQLSSQPGSPGDAKSNTILSNKTLILILVVVVAFVAIWVVAGKGNSPKSYSGSNSQSSYNDYSDYSPSYSSTPQYGNSGALASAKSYLRSSAFSYEGLIDQLEYEGFSHSEATYAANNCGANWNEQAVKCAQSYLRGVGGFSYDGLLDQLEYEKFTSAQAKYGVDNCGANWNAQAVQAAKSYMRTFPDWTKSKLIDQLKYEGFTQSQAKYGADNCGSFR